MELIRSLAQLRPRHRGCVATIGNFDGVHRGHQAVLQQLQQHAHALQLPATVIIFEPQPQEFFAPDRAPPRLTRLREKLLAFQRAGIERVLCLRFEKTAPLSAEDFIQHILIEGLAIKHLVVGDDFRFGKGRMGDFHHLQQAGERAGFSVESQHTFIIEGERVSSTRIRQALSQGDMLLASALLGHPYTLSGRVRHGFQRGRTIGFPTANIFLHRHASPVKGVFAVRVYGLDAQPINGVANLGTRPTVDGQDLLLEVHLFDFNRLIYGHYVEVEFVTKIREEQRFNSFEALKQQIQADATFARHYLEN
ncbi:bifunctional riboflavin kinase/FAD synthetase [Beggiatoa leptomitoformis]|uniref:Riboflavin biosynthesis protein n=1 Tax=Beggiatoa leptomitoformis TaxID=288004 RepID=A0A2N9YCR8_9GAMM|nr:bifunctional riboflavin kinase/FAD synthetase [Beggiatoa leptomitoformis]ALG66462.1 bifunctional riboflavin kinase/FAD synthetase [Beggiatoa leptomitoformis]AUI68255.1 bifunctional riboflavin kinase/FAD synthetase [Beggiatoa leptomitoformis]